MTNQHNYLLDRILCIEQKQLEHEKFFARIFADMDLEKPLAQKVFFNGQVYGAHSFLVDLIQSAKTEITLIDGYVAKETLDLLASKRPNVLVRIFTRPLPRSTLAELDVKKFNAEHPHLQLYRTKEFHDRFLILDRKAAYHIGASLKDAGKRCFAITKLEDAASVQNLISCAELPYNTTKMPNNNLVQTSYDYEVFRSQLVSLADDAYREFTMRGIPGCDRPFLGVRIPQVRSLVRYIPANALPSFIVETPVSFEEVIARGIAISRLPYEAMLSAFDSQLPFLDNWCAADTFCSGLRKSIKGRENDFFDQKIEPLFESRQEFVIRTGLVLLLNFYVNLEYLSVIFEVVEKFASFEAYYVKTAIAWLLAECYIEFPEATLNFLQTSSLPVWTFNRTISKICESTRVDSGAKDTLRTLRK